MSNCSICGDKVFSCEMCGDKLEKGDFIYCLTIGKHNHRDCMSLSKARVLK